MIPLRPALWGRVHVWPMNSPEGSSYLQIRIVRISIRVIDYGNNKMQPPFARRLGLTLLLSSAITACGGGSDGDSVTSSDPPPSAEASLLSAAALLGQKIFSDKALSVSGQQSCASCHVAQYAFTADPTASGPATSTRRKFPTTVPRAAPRRCHRMRSTTSLPSCAPSRTVMTPAIPTHRCSPRSVRPRSHPRVKRLVLP